MIRYAVGVTVAALLLSLSLGGITSASAQGVAPQGAGVASTPRAALPGAIGSQVPISDGLQRQPGGGGTNNLPDPTSGPAAAGERAVGVPSSTPIVQPRDLTGAPIPGITTAPPAARSPTERPAAGADTRPAPGR